MFRNTFPMRDNLIIPLSLGDQGISCTTSAFVCTSCTRGVQENAAIALGLMLHALAVQMNLLRKAMLL